MKNIDVECPMTDSADSRDKQTLVLFLLICCILGLPALYHQSPPSPPVYAVERVANTNRWQVTSASLREFRPRQEGAGTSHLNVQQSDASIYFSDTHAGCSLPADLALFFHCPLPLNQSRLEDLTMLPGIGPHRAALLLAERRKKGRLQRAEDLLAIPGIGPATLQRLLPLVSFE